MQNILTMIKFFPLLLLALIGGCATGPGPAYVLNYEVRVPGSIETPLIAWFEVVTPQSIASKPAQSVSNHLDGQCMVYSSDDLIYVEGKRFLVVKRSIAPSQVFELQIPRHPYPMSWTQWQKPDYLDSSKDPSWNVYYGVPDDNYSTNIPANCFQIRYSVRAWTEGQGLRY